MDHYHYISSDLLSLETINQILLEHKLLALSEEAKVNIQICRDYLDVKMQSQTDRIYGINTGFG